MSGLIEFVGFWVVLGLGACRESFCQEQSRKDPRKLGNVGEPISWTLQRQAFKFSRLSWSCQPLKGVVSLGGASHQHRSTHGSFFSRCVRETSLLGASVITNTMIPGSCSYCKVCLKYVPSWQMLEFLF